MAQNLTDIELQTNSADNFEMTENTLYDTPANPHKLTEIIVDRHNKFDVPFAICHEVYPNIIIGGK